MPSRSKTIFWRRPLTPDRYTNPENAAEATEAAALASEGAASIDESVEEELLTAAPAVEAAEDAITGETNHD